MAPAVPRPLHPDFCNKIGTKRTWRSGRDMSVIGATADVICSERVFRLLTRSGPPSSTGSENALAAIRAAEPKALTKTLLQIYEMERHAAVLCRDMNRYRFTVSRTASS